MYNLKRILEGIIDTCGEVGATAEIPTIRAAAAEALIEVAELERKETAAPQEMRDLFAGAAVMGQLANPFEGSVDSIVYSSWDYSDAMMLERARRIEQRRAANPPDSIGE